MRFLLGLLFGLILGGLLAVVIAAQMAGAQPEDAETFEGEERAPAAASGAP